MDYMMLAGLVSGGIAGYGIRHWAAALIVAAIVGTGMATAYHLWLHAEPSRGDALAGVGYLMALICPLSGCVMGWLARRARQKSE